MEIKTEPDVYNSLSSTYFQTGRHGSPGAKEADSAGAPESTAVIYGKYEQPEFSTYSVSSVQATADSAVIGKMKVYLKDLGFYDGEMSGSYTEKFKTALKCFQNAYYCVQAYNVESGIPSGLQNKIQNIGAAYYINLTNSKLTDALKKLGFGSNPPTEDRKNFARVQTFLEKGMGCTKYQIAGIMGNIKQESSFRPTAVNGDALGLIQWKGFRRIYLDDYAAKNGYSSTNIGAQFAYFRYELSSTWGTDCAGGYASNSDLVDAWRTLKNEYKYSFYDVSDFFMDKIEDTDENQQERRDYSSIIYQAIS